MGAFNPWKGFPSFNSVYLDPDFQRMRGNGQLAFGTFQEAYDAAAVLAVNTGKISVIMVGMTEAAVVGDVVLVANWNSDVMINGLGFTRSFIGLIDGRNAAGNGFDVPALYIGNVSSDGVNLSSTGGGGNGGGIGILTLGPVTLTLINTNGNGNGSAGNITLQGIGGLVTTISSTASVTGVGGNVVVETAFGNVGTIITSGGSGGSGTVSIGPNLKIDDIDTSNVNGGGGGNVVVGIATQVGTINVDGTNSGNVDLRTGVEVDQVTMGAAPGQLTAVRCTISEMIDAISGAASFDNVRLSSSGNDNCIDNVTGDGARFMMCIFRPSGTGLAIDASAPRIVLSQKTISRGEVGVNITTDGDFLVDPSV